MARNKAIGTWNELIRRRYVVGDDYPDPGIECWVIVEQADMLDTKLDTRYSGGAYRVRLTNVPDMRTKTFLGESAHHSAARYAADAASKCGDWRWWPVL